MHYVAVDERRMLDGTAALLRRNGGRARPKIVETVQKQVA
jgi:adenosylmethionine-8-amino-7-oxononanoate aminotransferase